MLKHHTQYANISLMVFTAHTNTFMTDCTLIHKHIEAHIHTYSHVCAGIFVYKHVLMNHAASREYMHVKSPWNN